MGSTVLMTRAGAQQGAAVLATNAILFQMFMLSALILDGFESAAQVLCGEALGAGDRARFRRLVRALALWAGLGAAVIAVVYLFAGRHLAASFSTDPQVAALTGVYVGWAVALPLAGVLSFVLDGVFIGSSWTRAMMLSMAGALVVFLLVLTLARPLGNQGLWLAFSVFFVMRGLGQSAMLPGLIRRSFGP